LRFVSDAGLLLASKAEVTLNASTNPALRQDLDAERGQLAKHGVGVVASLGAAYVAVGCSIPDSRSLS
jgi:hypothetical protein